MALAVTHSRSLFAEEALVPDGWARNVRVLLDDAGRISAVERDTVKASGDTELTDRVLLPAPANVHSHAFQRALAGRSERRRGNQDDFWSWREQMFDLVGRLGPDDLEAMTAQAFMEMLEAGYAAVAEFHYVHHAPDGRPYDDLAELAGRIVAAAARTGIGLTLLPVLYGFGGAGGQPLSARQRRFANDPDRFAKLLEAAGSILRLELATDARLGLAPHSLRAVVPTWLDHLWAQSSEAPIHIHIAEQAAEVRDVRAWLGARPVEWLLDHAPVDDRFCLIHATQTTPEELRAIARRGATVGLCPITEANLGDGVFPVSTWLEMGGAFGIGTDSNVRIALAEELRLLEYEQRLLSCTRAVIVTPPHESVGRSLFEQALRGGARALGRTSGSIAVGQWADLVALSRNDDRMVEQTGDGQLDAWIFAADDRVVSDVWSAGRHVVVDGRHVARSTIAPRFHAALRACTRR